jgi:hypothetical protein
MQRIERGNHENRRATDAAENQIARVARSRPLSSPAREAFGRATIARVIETGAVSGENSPRKNTIVAMEIAIDSEVSASMAPDPPTGRAGGGQCARSARSDASTVPDTFEVQIVQDDPSQ